MTGIVKEIYPNGKMSKNLTTDEILKRIKEEREKGFAGEPVTFTFGSTERIIRKAICNGRF